MRPRAASRRGSRRTSQPMTGRPAASIRPRSPTIRDSVSRNDRRCVVPGVERSASASAATGGGADVPTPKVKVPDVLWPSAADSARQLTV